MRSWLLSTSTLILICAGCGTTRWSDTQRTATEQLLVTDAMDRAVSRLDFHALADKKVYLDATALRTSTDAAYLASSLRQQMLAQKCIVKDKREDADYVVEARAGAIGTDRREVLFGVPATRMPEVGPMAGVPAAVPELPLAKRTEQRAVAKIALFAYNRETGRPVWQSGIIPVESKVKDLWVLGAGPFQRGSIAEAKPGDKKTKTPPARAADDASRKGRLALGDEAFFVEPKEDLARPGRLSAKKDVKDELARGGPPAAKKDAAPPSKPEAKPADTAGPLDAVVPAGFVEPPTVSSQPNSGMDGFWPSSATTPTSPFQPQSPTAPLPSGTQPPVGLPTAAPQSVIPPLSGILHGSGVKGKEKE